MVLLWLLFFVIVYFAGHCLSYWCGSFSPHRGVKRLEPAQKSWSRDLTIQYFERGSEITFPVMDATKKHLYSYRQSKISELLKNLTN